MGKKKKKRGFLKRWILFASGLLVLLLLLLFLVGVIWVSPVVKKAVEVYGPEVLGAEVKMEDVDVGFVRGVAKIDGLVVANPEGYKEPIAIQAETLKISLQMRSVFSDTVVINDILLDSPVISYEKHKGVNNLVQLQKNAVAWADSLSDGEKKESSTKVIIKRFRIKNGTLRVKLPALPAVPIKLADIERNDIGGEDSNAQNFGHATKDILASLQLNAADTVKNAGGSIEKAAKEALKTGENVGKDALKAGEKVLDDAGDALKGLFK